MHRTRYLVAVTLVATALCAERGVSAAPVLRPVMGESARQLAGKLVGSFRPELAAVRLSPVVRPGPVVVGEAAVHVADPEIRSHSFELAPFWYRLPPPTYDQ